MFRKNDRHQFTFDINWTPSVERDGCYVIETTTDDRPGHYSKFGPMPPDMIALFVAERKAYWQSIIDAQLAKFYAPSSSGATYGRSGKL